KVPSGWKLINVAGDKRICNVTHAFDGGCSIQFKGSAAEKAIVRQVVTDVSALTAGDTLYLSGAFKSAYGSPKVVVLLKVKYAGVPAVKTKLIFKTKQAVFVESAAERALTGTPVKLIVDIRNTSAGGKQYVDAVSLTLNDATRTARPDGELLPPPAAPADFRGNN